MAGESWYWDTCIFVALLNGNRTAYGHHIDHIAQFLEECRRGECAIYTSTLTIAEISQKHLRDSTYGSFSDFLNDYSGSIRQVIADPNVMLLASAIRSLTYTRTGGNREVGTPDAIHLASAIVLERNYGVPIAGFHTFDNGKSKELDGGKAVPLLTYETWCETCANDPIAKRVIALNRSRPDHPNPKLPLPEPPQPIPAVATTSSVKPNGAEEAAEQDPPHIAHPIESPATEQADGSERKDAHDLPPSVAPPNASA